MNNTTWEINGLTFELDLDDALDMERYENAFKRLQEKAETLHKNADSASTKIKNTCTAYRNLIDDVFGDGTSAKIIPPDCWKLRNHEDMIASFMAFIEAQAATNKARVTAFTAKYKPVGRTSTK